VRGVGVGVCYRSGSNSRSVADHRRCDFTRDVKLITTHSYQSFFSLFKLLTFCRTEADSRYLVEQESEEHQHW